MKKLLLVIAALFVNAALFAGTPAKDFLTGVYDFVCKVTNNENDFNVELPDVVSYACDKTGKKLVSIDENVNPITGQTETLAYKARGTVEVYKDGTPSSIIITEPFSVTIYSNNDKLLSAKIGSTYTVKGKAKLTLGTVLSSVFLNLPVQKVPAPVLKADYRSLRLYLKRCLPELRLLLLKAYFL